MATGTSSSRSSSSPASVEEIFKDYCNRRTGLIRALTHDVDKFFESCDPDKDDLCLFGYPNESWEVTVPSETVPSEIPEPTTGINFARDGVDRTDWVYMVAVHSDSWLMAVAFYHAGCAQLNSVERNRLFTLINDVPDVYEVVRDWKHGKGKLKEDRSNEANGSKSRSGVKRSSGGNTKSTQKIVEDSHIEDEEHWETHCGSCGFVYNGDEFWIACDMCRLWYHGKCVGITPTKAESIRNYKCPFCHKRRTRA